MANAPSPDQSEKAQDEAFLKYRTALLNARKAAEHKRVQEHFRCLLNEVTQSTPTPNL